MGVETGNTNPPETGAEGDKPEKFERTRRGGSGTPNTFEAALQKIRQERTQNKADAVRRGHRHKRS